MAEYAIAIPPYDDTTYGLRSNPTYEFKTERLDS